jgi:xanthosine utilization system XapX-like protein
MIGVFTGVIIVAVVIGIGAGVIWALALLSKPEPASKAAAGWLLLIVGTFVVCIRQMASGLRQRGCKWQHRCHRH